MTQDAFNLWRSMSTLSQSVFDNKENRYLNEDEMSTLQEEDLFNSFDDASRYLLVLRGGTL
jgi:hypothetical protein